MTAATLLTELYQLGIEVWANGNRLRYKPRSALTAELRARLVDQKADLLRVLEHTWLILSPSYVPFKCDALA